MRNFRDCSNIGEQEGMMFAMVCDRGLETTHPPYDVLIGYKFKEPGEGKD